MTATRQGGDSLPASSPPEEYYYSEETLKSLEYLELPPPKQGRLHAMILEDPVSQLNAPRPIVLKTEDSVAKAASLMRKFRYGSVLVLNGERLAGIFTEKDLVGKTSEPDVDIETTSLGDVMTPDPQVVEEEDTLAHVLHLMALGRYRHVPVVRAGRPIGFCSIRGILRYLAQNALAGK